MGRLYLCCEQPPRSPTLATAPRRCAGPERSYISLVQTRQDSFRVLQEGASNSQADGGFTLLQLDTPGSDS